MRAWTLLGIGLGLGMGIPLGCLNVPSYQCDTDLSCVAHGKSGRCFLGSCVYVSGACANDTGWEDAAGECVEGPSFPGESDDQGEASDDDTPPVATSSASTSGTDPTAGEDTLQLEDTGDPTTTGEPPDPTTGTPQGCTGPMDDITSMGVVDADSVFDDNYQPYLSVDGSYASSWFSSGPGPGGSPSIYTWSVLSPLCVAQVTITGNGLHQNPDFRQGFGFDSVAVRVYDDADAVVFQQMFSLAGTPDPAIIAYPDVEGVRVELELANHETSNCGGFSELEIVGN